MSPQNLREEWNAVADAVDALRIIPRLLVLGFALFAILTIGDVIGWYKALPAEERAIEASGFAFGVITAITGLFTKALEIYTKTGRSPGGE